MYPNFGLLHTALYMGVGNVPLCNANCWDYLDTHRGRMAYRNVINVTTEEGRKDSLATWGLGLGRHLPSGVRVGFDADYERRVSVIDGRGFHGFRFGGSVTYGS